MSNKRKQLIWASPKLKIFVHQETLLWKHRENLQMVKNIFKSHIWSDSRVQSIERTITNHQQEQHTKNPQITQLKKYVQRIWTDISPNGQQVHATMLHILSRYEDANSNHSELGFKLPRMAITKKKGVWRNWNLVYCWLECKIIFLLWKKFGSSIKKLNIKLPMIQ